MNANKSNSLTFNLRERKIRKDSGKMNRAVFRVEGRKIVITRGSILSALKEYDRLLRDQNNDSWRRYAVKHDERFYPPKRILRLAMGMPRARFSGGEGNKAANQVFRKLDFEIVSLSRGQGTVSCSPKSVSPQTKLDSPIPTIQSLVESLLSQKWTNLHANHQSLEDAEYPGVYILAYSDENLEGKQVKEEEVFYVGMSHAGTRKRLRQFIRGLEDGKHHSGAGRFFKDYAGRVPYSLLPSKKTFFVSSVAVPCIVAKDARTPQDLRKMGEIARLEFHLLAHIKEKLHAEPELNKK